MNIRADVGRTIWITGLSGAGKTTISKLIKQRLDNDGIQSILLDGDELRGLFEQDASHGAEARMQLAKKYSSLCKILSSQNITVIIATMSLFHEVHKWNRSNLINYTEVYLKVPLEILKIRDPKGLYKKFDIGMVKNICGCDLSFEEPQNPDIEINFSEKEYSKFEIVEIIHSKIT